MDNVLLCNLCKQPGKYLCQRCKDGYCSIYCQTLDWPKHKVLCIPMPALIPAPLPIEKLSINSSCDSTVTSIEKDSRSLSVSAESSLVKENLICVAEKLISIEKGFGKMTLDKNWLTIVPLPENEFFEAVVLSVDCENIVWAMKASLQQAWDVLFKEINQEMVSQQPYHQKKLLVGEIYCVPYQKHYYRGILLEKMNNGLRTVYIRLIDNGTMIEAPINSVTHLNSQLRSIHAFAFPIKTNRKLSVDEKLLIKVLEKVNNVYLVDFQESSVAIKFPSILDELHESNEGKICIKKILTKKKFLTVTTALTTMTIFDNGDFQQKCKTNYLTKSNIKIDPFMVGLTPEGFRRGKVIAFYDYQYVFASIDDGIYTLVNRIFPIEDPFMLYPNTVTICDILEVYDEYRFHKNISKDNCLAIKITDRTDDSCKIIILEDDQVLASGMLKKWDFSLHELDVNYWTADIKSGTPVRVTYVHNFNTFSICPEVSINTYNNMLESIYEVSESAFESKKKIEENEIFLYLNEAGRPFRGVSSYRDNALYLNDLETGMEVKVNNLDNLKNIYNHFVTSAPVFTRKEQIRNFPSVVPANIMELVNDVIKQDNKFIIEYNNDYNNTGCDLFNAEKESIVDLVKKKIHNICENVFKITTIPIPIGSDIELFILDVSQLESGVVTACINDIQMITNILQKDVKITEYCDAHPTAGYRPNNDELCLSKFAKDNRWYRTLCLTSTSVDDYLVLFMDYGNIETVSYKNIIKITSDFLYPALAQTCIIKEFSAEKLEMAKQLFVANNFIKINHIEKSNDYFIIVLNNLCN